MSIIELIKIEFMKVKRSMILPLLLIPPILVVVSGVSSISMYMSQNIQTLGRQCSFKVHYFLDIITSILNGSCLCYDCQQRNKE